jgi:hypothetical protein
MMSNAPEVGSFWLSEYDDGYVYRVQETNGALAAYAVYKDGVFKNYSTCVGWRSILYTQVANAQGGPLTEYRTLTDEMARRLKKRPKGLEHRPSEAGVPFSESSRSLFLLQERGICNVDGDYQYPICPENSDAELFGPKREKYVYYETGKDSHGNLGIRIPDGMGLANMGMTYGAHSGIPIDGRYCRGYTNHKNKHHSPPLRVTDDRGVPYKYALFIDPDMEG